MKRLLPFIMSFIFAVSLTLSGCSEMDRSGELREFLSLNEDSFGEAFTEEPCSFSDFSSYMKNWAKASSLDILYEGEHAIVLKNSAADGYEDEPSCLLLCSFNTSSGSSNKNLIATAQTSLLGPLEHGDIMLAVSEKTDNQFVGISEIPKKYLACDNLINLSKAGSNNILTSGPVAGVSAFHRSGKKAESTYAQAFEIKLSMPEYTDPYDFAKGSSYPNPINTIGGFLASSQSAGKLFDIASFESKANEGCTPYFAKAVVVVDSNHIESFQSRFEKSYDNIQEKFQDADEKTEESFEYTMEETDMPDSVLSDDVAVGLISLMYTLNTGVCQQDEESGIIYSASYIQSVKTKKGDLDIKVDMRARGESYLDSLSSEYETTAGLCSTKYDFSKTGRLWTSDPNSNLVSYFTSCVPQTGPVENAVSLKPSENDILAEKLPKQNMIIYTFEKGDRKTVLDNLIHFLDPAVARSGAE